MKNLATSLLLFAILAISAQVAKADYHWNDHYPKAYKNKYYTGHVQKDFIIVKGYVSDNFYKKCQKYEEPKKVNVLVCLLSNRCYDYHEEPCCTHDGYEYKHACFAKCFGYTTYYPGKCAKHNPPPVSLPPAPVYGPKCGKFSYCKVDQQCCSNYGYKTCCAKYSTCCGPLCCGKDQTCDVSYYWAGHYKKTKYTCKNKVYYHPVKVVNKPYDDKHHDDKHYEDKHHNDKHYHH